MFYEFDQWPHYQSVLKFMFECMCVTPFGSVIMPQLVGFVASLWILSSHSMSPPSWVQLCEIRKAWMIKALMIKRAYLYIYKKMNKTLLLLVQCTVKYAFNLLWSVIGHLPALSKLIGTVCWLSIWLDVVIIRIIIIVSCNILTLFKWIILSLFIFG